MSNNKTLPLKLKDSDGNLQQISATEKNYVAYLAGLQNAQADSSDVGLLTLASSGNRGIGSTIDTYYPEPVGAHPYDQTSVISTTRNLYQINGTASESDSDFRLPIAHFGAHVYEQPTLNFNAFTDEINARIALSDYPGSLKLSPTAPSSDYSILVPSVLLDKRADSAGNAIIINDYSIWRRDTMTAPSAIFDSKGGISSLAGIKRSNGDSGTFQGIQKLTDRQIQVSVGQRAKTRRAINGNVGSYELRTASQGAPAAGTWSPKGTATNTIRLVNEVAYTRTSTRSRGSAYARTRVGNYTRTSTRSDPENYTGNYGTTYIGNYTRTFAGNYTGNYTGDYTRNFLGNYTRGFVGDYTGNYVGDYSRNFTRNRTSAFNRTRASTYLGNYTGNYSRNFERTRNSNYERSRVSTYQRGFVGNYTRSVVDSFAGNYVGDYSRTGIVTRESNYTRTRIQTRISAYTRSFLGNYVGGDTTYGTETAFGRTRVSNYSRNFTSVFSRQYLRQSVREFTRNFAGNYTGSGEEEFYFGGGSGQTGFARTFTRTRVSNYQRGFIAAFSREFTRSSSYSRTIAYTGNYMRTRTTSYSRSFLGQYTRTSFFATVYTGTSGWGPSTMMYVGNYARAFSREYTTASQLFVGTETLPEVMLNGTLSPSSANAVPKYVLVKVEATMFGVNPWLYTGNLFREGDNTAYGYRSGNTAVPDTNPVITTTGTARSDGGLNDGNSDPSGYTVDAGETLVDLDVVADEYSGAWGGVPADWRQDGQYSAVVQLYSSALGWDWSSTNMGTLAAYTFVDHSNTTRYIQDLWWHKGNIDSSSGYSDNKGLFVFSLGGTDIPNTDTTFKSLQMGSLLLNRSDATYDSSSNGNTVWWWDLTSANHTSIGGNSASSFVVRGATNATGPAIYTGTSSIVYRNEFYTRNRVVEGAFTRGSAAQGDFTRISLAGVQLPGDQPNPRVENFNNTYVRNRAHTNAAYARAVGTDTIEYYLGAGFYTGNYVGNASFLGNYLRLFTGNFTRSFNRNRILTRSSSFSRDRQVFTEDTTTSARILGFSRNYERTRLSSYSRNFTLIRTSSYARDFTRNFLGNFVGGDTTYGTETKYAGNFTRNFERTRVSNYQRGFLGNYAREFTRTRLSSYNRTFTGNYLGDYTRDFIGDFTRDYNRTSTRNRDSSRTSAYNRTRLSNFARAFVGDFTRNFAGNYARNFSADYTRIRTSSFARTRISNYSRNRGSIYSQAYSDVYSGIYSREYTRNRSSNYTRTSTRDSTRDRDSTYTRTRGSTFNRLRTSAFSGDFTGDYTRNFEGNYSRNFAGNYVGNYVGQTIGNNTLDVETYTLYVRTS